jgi:hypothetical protein
MAPDPGRVVPGEVDHSRGRGTTSGSARRIVRLGEVDRSSRRGGSFDSARWIVRVGEADRSSRRGGSFGSPRRIVRVAEANRSSRRGRSFGWLRSILQASEVHPSRSRNGARGAWPARPGRSCQPLVIARDRARAAALRASKLAHLRSSSTLHACAAALRRWSSALRARSAVSAAPGSSAQSGVRAFPSGCPGMVASIKPWSAGEKVIQGPREAPSKPRIAGHR